ncbi:MAG: JAB domain-containing protein (plasmid) [Candidatus Manganitrophus sp.]|nr:MAG: JAB domain-containing protein [Candidatus Manganitrophus sp.]
MHWVKLKQIKTRRPRWAKPVASKEEVHAMLKRYYRFHDREEALIICLDMKNVPTHIHSLAVGSISLCIIHPREVFKVALLSNAAQMILVHNHPSGDPTPSKEDWDITERLRRAGEIMGVGLLDSLIIGEGEVRSILKTGWP